MAFCDEKLRRTGWERKKIGLSTLCYPRTEAIKEMQRESCSRCGREVESEERRRSGVEEV